MPRVKDIINIMEEKFPLYLAEKWDNVGLQIGSSEQSVNKILLTLDLDIAALEHAVKHKADLIVTHHPLIFKPIAQITSEAGIGNIIQRLIQAGISVYSAHTNLDAAEAGLNQKLAEILGLQQISPLFSDYEDSLYKLVVFVPLTHEEEVRTALGKAGAGHIGQYSDCSFRTPGIGAFKPKDGANPFIGRTDQLEQVDEIRLETVVYLSQLKHVITQMKLVHPYEEVAYDIYPLRNQGRIYSLGRRGVLKKALSLEQLARQVKQELQLDAITLVGDMESKVRTVAVISGSGSSFINKAAALNIDVLITGDIKYHEAKNAELLGMNLIDAGHQGTEQIIVDYLAELLQAEFKLRKWKLPLIGFKNNPCFKYV